MPTGPAARQKAAGAALSARPRGTSKSDLKGASGQKVVSMSERQREESARPNRNGKPEHVAKD